MNPAKLHLSEFGQRVVGRLPGLDALRGVAALCVLSFHAFGEFGSGHPLVGKGYLAVDFFFMLSGYVMARTYEHRFAQGYDTTRFMKSRYRRLWPVMAIGALIGAPMLAIETRGGWAFLAVAIPNFALIPAIAGTVIFPINSAGWSIFFELAANLAHSLLFWRWRTGSLAFFSLCMLPAMIWVSIHFGTYNVGSRSFNVLGGLPRTMLSYGIGIVLWRWWRDRPTIAIPPVAAFAAMPVALLLCHLFAIDSWMFDIGFVIFLCPLLIAGGLAYVGSHWAARWSGMISFPLYAVHLPLLQLTNGLGFGSVTGVALALTLATYIALRMKGPSETTKAKIHSPLKVGCLEKP
jgi:peptidoglycan/LPS O-acetylase OafA/YrhL